ncbi:MAG: NfeD family protein [Defluviitaleaceae bacterium]|nr:NfeD family protein [Defluviitaleaceae bacterium]
MYIVMLVVGLGFLLITLVVGELFEMEGARLSFLSPSVIAVFLGVAGAVGTFMGGNLGAMLLLAVSLGAGFVASLLVSKLIIQPLHRAQNTSTVYQQDLIGMRAVVDSPIAQGDYGRIVYTVNGSRVTSPAKCGGGEKIETGAAVEITHIENNTFFVRKI